MLNALRERWRSLPEGRGLGSCGGINDGASRVLPGGCAVGAGEPALSLASGTLGKFPPREVSTLSGASAAYESDAGVGIRQRGSSRH